MDLKDFVVTISVLDRVVHKFIIRARNEDYALTKAKDIVIELQELTSAETILAQYSVTPFYDLDKQQVFVCF
jgi:hypothetical protein